MKLMCGAPNPCTVFAFRLVAASGLWRILGSMRTDYYDDLRFCSGCRGYMYYLQSLANAYCVECGERASLFSPEDTSAFRKATFRIRAATRALAFERERRTEQPVA